MKQLLEMLGMGDGEGNTSSTRLAVMLILATILLSKFYVSVRTGQEIIWDDNTLSVIKILFATLVTKSVAEGVGNKLTQPPAAVQPKI